ncbi:MAG TPA: M23 family metallopeptidase [Steroidobacteraceae bacterium]
MRSAARAGTVSSTGTAVADGAAPSRSGNLGGGQFAHNCHLQPGSVRVKVGERVKRGQAMALIGASGDAREPHLHFEIANSPKPFAGEGLFYLIDHFSVRSENGWGSRARELPLKDKLIDFGH